jgi:arabinogalactan oligomer/maltooligosaccharide transport system substrate-binding protein
VNHIDLPTIRSTSLRTLRAGALLLLLVAALLLAACNRDEESAAGNLAAGSQAAVAGQQAGESAIPGTPLPPPTPFIPQGDLTLWHSWGGADADALTQILTRMKEQFPAVNVQTLFVAANDMPQAYADAVRAGGGPDVAITANWWLSDLVDAQVVRPLNDLVQPGQIEQFNGAAQRNFVRDGTVYGLPTTFETVGLFRNNALAGDSPVPNTTDALLAQAAISPTLGIGLYANLYHVWWGFPAYGAQLFDAGGAVALDQSGGAAKYLAWLEALKATPGSFVDGDYGMLIDRFKKGEFAYFVDGPWATAELRDALGDALAVVPLPAGRVGGAQPWLSSDGAVLNPNLSSDRTLLAYFLASALTDPGAGATFASTAGRLPANTQAALPADAIQRGFMQQAATASPAPPQRQMDAVWGYGGDMLIKVLDGDMEPAAAVAETVALINEETQP